MIEPHAKLVVATMLAGYPLVNLEPDDPTVTLFVDEFKTVSAGTDDPADDLRLGNQIVDRVFSWCRDRFPTPALVRDATRDVKRGISDRPALPAAPLDPEAEERERIRFGEMVTAYWAEHPDHPFHPDNRQARADAKRESLMDVVLPRVEPTGPVLTRAQLIGNAHVGAQVVDGRCSVCRERVEDGCQSVDQTTPPA